MIRMPIRAAFLLLVLAGCDEEAQRPDGGCEPSVPSGADAGGRVSADYPTCCFAVTVPATGAITAIRGGDASAPIGAGVAFPSPTAARWVGATRSEGGAALELEIEGEAWTVSVSESAPIPEPPAGGVDVELTAAAARFFVTRASDGALLVAWIRDTAERAPLDATRSAGPIELALGTACYGWQESGFGCGRGFLVYGIDASSGGEATYVAPHSTSALEVSGVRYSITNRIVSQRGGESGAVCADFTLPVFDADVILDAL